MGEVGGTGLGRISLAPMPLLVAVAEFVHANLGQVLHTAENDHFAAAFQYHCEATVAVIFIIGKRCLPHAATRLFEIAKRLRLRKADDIRVATRFINVLDIVESEAA